MTAARPGMSFESAPDRRVQLNWDLAGTLQAAAILVCVEAAFVAALLCYRLGAQFMAWTDMGAPWSWLYWLAGLFAAPFAGLETVRTMQPGGATFEFSTMVALETYLVGALVLVVLLGGLSLLARRRSGRSWHWSIDTGPAVDAWHNLEPSLSSAAEDAGYHGRNGLVALRKRLASGDWMRWPVARRTGSWSRRLGREAR